MTYVQFEIAAAKREEFLNALIEFCHTQNVLPGPLAFGKAVSPDAIVIQVSEQVVMHLSEEQVSKLNLIR